MDVMEFFLECGVDFMLINKIGLFVFYCVVGGVYFDVVKLFIENRFKIVDLIMFKVNGIMVFYMVIYNFVF